MLLEGDALGSSGMSLEQCHGITGSRAGRASQGSPGPIVLGKAQGNAKEGSLVLLGEHVLSSAVVVS